MTRSHLPRVGWCAACAAARAYFPLAPSVYAPPMMELQAAMQAPSTMLMQPPMMQPEPPQPVPLSLRTMPAHYPVLPAPVGAPPTQSFVIAGQFGLWTPAPPFP